MGAGVPESAAGECECADLGLGVWNCGGVGGEGHWGLVGVEIVREGGEGGDERRWERGREGGRGLVGVEIVREGGEGGDERRGKRGREGEERVVDSFRYNYSKPTLIFLLCIMIDCYDRVSPPSPPHPHHPGTFLPSQRLRGCSIKEKGRQAGHCTPGSHAPVGTLFSVPLLLAVIHHDIPSLIVKERGSFEFVSAFRDYPRLPACAKDHIHCWEAR